MDKKDKIKGMKMPPGKKIKKDLDNWINEYVNEPLAKRGHENTAAALSAALSSTGELLIPDNLADAAMALVPGARLLKSAKKGYKAIKKVDKAPLPGTEKAGTLDYGKIKQAEKAKAAEKRKRHEETADTLAWDKKGEITRKPPTTKEEQSKDILEELSKLLDGV